MNDKTVGELQADLPSHFLETFAVGVQAYVDGDWEAAKAALEEALALKPRDGPAGSLLHFMQALAFAPPTDWRGCRALADH